MNKIVERFVYMGVGFGICWVIWRPIQTPIILQPVPTIQQFDDATLNYARHRCINIIDSELIRLYNEEVLAWEDTFKETPDLSEDEKTYFTKNIAAKKNSRDNVMKVVEELRKTIPDAAGM